MSEKPGISSRFKRSEIEKTTDKCSVCGEEINFFGMYHHMRTLHHEHLAVWLSWATSVVLAFAVPVAVLILLLVLVGGQNVLLLILAVVVLIVVLQVVIDRMGKRWEKRVGEEWRAAHPLQDKKKSRKGR